MNSALVIAMIVAMALTTNVPAIGEKVASQLSDVNIVTTDTSTKESNNVVECKSTGFRFECPLVLMSVVDNESKESPGLYTDQFYHMHNMWRGMDKKNVTLDNTCYFPNCREIYNISVSRVNVDEISESEKSIYDMDQMLFSFKPGKEVAEYFTADTSIKELGNYKWYCKQLIPSAVAAGSKLYSLEAIAFDGNMRIRVLISMHGDESVSHAETYGADKVEKINTVVEKILSTLTLSEIL